MVEKLIKLLEGTKTREALAECWQDIVFSAHAILNEDVEGWEAGDDAHAIDLAFDFTGYPISELRVMRTAVLEKISPPHIITAEELTDALFSLLPRYRDAWMGEDAFENVYPAFLNRVRSFLPYRCSLPFAIAQSPPGERSDRAQAVEIAFIEGVSAASGRKQDKPIDESYRRVMKTLSTENHFEIWSGNGVSVGTSGTERGSLNANVKGWISPSAMEMLVQELGGIIRSAVRSSIAAAEESPNERWPVDSPTVLPIAGVELVKREASFVRMCLDSYFAKPTSKKDSLDRRIRNAVALLVEADNQKNHAVGIALAVTAIEALLGHHGEGICAALCDRISALLEPDREQRSEADDFIKSVYNDRSRVLHGEKLDATEERRTEIRLLASGVLYAVVNYVDFLRRGGFDPQTPGDLKNELREGKYRPGQPMGVPELPRVWNLWRKADQKAL